MSIWKKSLSRVSVIVALLCLSPISVSQTITPSDDILDFLPAIIAAAISETETTVTPPLEPPVNGLGNLRFTKTEGFNLIQPTGRSSELITSWDQTGNYVRQDLTAYDLFAASPSQVRSTTVFNIDYDEQNRPRSSAYTSMIDADTQEVGTKQYRYLNGRLQSTSAEATITNSVIGSITTSIETVFEYAQNNQLVGATVIVSNRNDGSNTTEQHFVGYDSSNRVNSHRVTRSNNITNTPEVTVHSHSYDSVGNLAETVITTPTNIEVTKANNWQSDKKYYSR